MTQPRRIVPGLTYLITRRTQHRTYLFRPDEQMKEIYLYLLAVLAKKHGIEVHGVTLMSTHEHIVLTDTRGILPRFLAEFHRLVALCVKAYRKWDSEVWDGGKTSVVELCTQRAIVEKLAYCAANPVAAGLVHKAADWPGVTTLPSDLGNARWEAKRPAHYLDQNSALWPKSATLELSLPPLRRGAEVLREDVASELRRLERSARADAKDSNFLIRGVRFVKEVSPFARAKSGESLRGRNPCFAVGRGQKHAFFAAARALTQFRNAYRVALDMWKAGIRTVAFPRETWLMAVLHQALIA